MKRKGTSDGASAAFVKLALSAQALFSDFIGHSRAGGISGAAKKAAETSLKTVDLHALKYAVDDVHALVGVG